MLHFLHFRHLIAPEGNCFRFVSQVETLCFLGGNTLFPYWKQSVPTVGTTGNHYPKQAKMSVVALNSMGCLTGFRCSKCSKCTLFFVSNTKTKCYDTNDKARLRKGL